MKNLASERLSAGAASSEPFNKSTIDPWPNQPTTIDPSLLPTNTCCLPALAGEPTTGSRHINACPADDEQTDTRSKSGQTANFCLKPSLRPPKWRAARSRERIRAKWSGESWPSQPRRLSGGWIAVGRAGGREGDRLFIYADADLADIIDGRTSLVRPSKAPRQEQQVFECVI